MARRKTTTAVSIDGIAPDLNPKDDEVKFIGSENKFVAGIEGQERKVAMARAFAWYNRFYGRKDAKDLLAAYLDHNNRSGEAKVVRKAADNAVHSTYGWLARMTQRGLVLTTEEQETLNGEIARLIKSVTDPEEKVSTTSITKAVEQPKEQAPKANVQEIMRERASEAAGELEGMFDDFIEQGPKLNHTFKPIDVLAKKNVMPQHVPMIADIWKRHQAEFEAVAEGSDKQLNEGYAYLSKVQIRHVGKFIEFVINELNNYVNVKKVARKPRARKAVPVEKIVAKLKYLKEYIEPKSKLKITSVPAAKLHGASEAWVYDAAKRKLHHFIADEYSKTFTVKGTTLLGFDESQSEMKTLRTPETQLKEVMGSRPAARKFFKDIKTVAAKPTGRFNEDMIILKAF